MLSSAPRRPIADDDPGSIHRFVRPAGFRRRTLPQPMSTDELLQGLVAVESAYQQLDKQAFVYDEQEDCYWCPEGKRLSYTGTTSEKKSKDRTRKRRRYRLSSNACEACPLLAICAQNKEKSRTINREQHESLREEHATKMATDEAKDKYSRRRHPGERPFAVIKQKFGARRFLLRGLEQVKQEWQWMTTAFNLDRLIGLMRGGAGPPPNPA